MKSKLLVIAGILGAVVVAGVVGCREERRTVVVREPVAVAPPGYVLVPEAPPPAIVESPGPPPGPGFVWIHGYWIHPHARYEWVRGHWERPPHARAVWAAPRWERTEHGWRHEPGRWRN
jgi:hypothetical protein